MICDWTCPKYWETGSKRLKTLIILDYFRLNIIFHKFQLSCMPSKISKEKEKEVGKGLIVLFLSFHAF